MWCLGLRRPSASTRCAVPRLHALTVHRARPPTYPWRSLRREPKAVPLAMPSLPEQCGVPSDKAWGAAPAPTRACRPGLHGKPHPVMPEGVIADNGTPGDARNHRPSWLRDVPHDPPMSQRLLRAIMVEYAKLWEVPCKALPSG